MSDPLLPATGSTWADAESWSSMGSWRGPFNYRWETPTTWEEMGNWLGDGNSSGEFVRGYITPTIDLGRKRQVWALVDADTDDDCELSMRWSDNGTTWRAWRPTTARINGRYLQVRAVVSGDPPVLNDITTVVVAKLVEEAIANLDTTDIARLTRYGTGTVRVPVTEAFEVIETVQIVLLDNAGFLITPVVLDKNITGPKLLFYRPDAMVLTDAKFDIIIRGY